MMFPDNGAFDAVFGGFRMAFSAFSPALPLFSFCRLFAGLLLVCFSGFWIS
jgi:hypothetical protein